MSPSTEAKATLYGVRLACACGGRLRITTDSKPAGDQCLLLWRAVHSGGGHLIRRDTSSDGA